MAIFHLSVKPVSRSAGRSATAAAAYRAGKKGEKIVDKRTGEIHDYTRKSGVESADIVLPDGAPEWATDRAKLWNAAELSEKRKDACVAREFEVALPAELSPVERRKLVLEFAKDMANREGCAVDVAIHAPGKEGDNRNHHAHILRTTRKVEADGLGAKLDTEQAGRKRKDDLGQVRERWASLCNVALERAGHAERVDHRTLQAQGIDLVPTTHLGPAATAIERRGEVSQKTEHHQERQREAADKADDLARQLYQVEYSIARAELDREHEAREQAKAQKAKEVPELADLPMAQQVLVYEKNVKNLAEARQVKAERVSKGVQKRHERRKEALQAVFKLAIPQPTGLLAVFKQRAYKETMDALEPVYQRARKLVEQAGALQKRVLETTEEFKAWAYAVVKVQRDDPGLVQRIEAHRHQEATERKARELAAETQRQASQEAQKKADSAAEFKRMAAAFANESAADALKKYPQLAGAVAVAAAIDKQMEIAGRTPEERAIGAAHVHQKLTNSIERGEIPPPVTIRTQVLAASTEKDQDASR